MDFSNRRYSEDEVSAIVRRALEGKTHADTITHDDLVSIAAQSGISTEQLEKAIEEQETLGELESAKAEWLRRHRGEFFNHLRAYLIVIGFLMMINLMTSRSYPWFIWPALGWGIGIAFHASETFFVSEARVEKGARRILKKKQRKGKVTPKDIYQQILDETMEGLSK